MSEHGKTKPRSVIPSAEQFPPNSLSAQRWTAWRPELLKNQTTGKEEWTKVPISARTGTYRIGVTPKGKDGQDWTREWFTFAVTLAAVKRLNLYGMGFVFVKGDGRVGVDFDNCRNPETGEIRPSVKRWLDKFATFAEVSISSTGVHAIACGELQAPGNKKPLPEDPIVQVEMYDSSRFFVCTGERLEGHPLEFRPLQAEISELHQHVFGDSKPVDPTPREQGTVREVMTDKQIKKRITSFSKWAQIFNKNAVAADFVVKEYGADDSKADEALCTFVAHYSVSRDQILRLWKQSILWREKAEKREDYRSRTINKALSSTAESRCGAKVDTRNRTEIDWLWKDRFPRGKLALLDGDPGLSKSMFSLSMAVSVMTGKPFLGGDLPTMQGGVLLLSAEDDLRDTINPRLLAAGAPEGEIPLIHIPSTKLDGRQFSLANDDDRLELEMLVAQINAKLIIIDPLNAYLGDKIDSHNDQKIRQVLGPLSEMANRTGAVVLCLRHLSKAGGNKAIYRGMGSIGYTAAARANFFVSEHPEEKDAFVFAASKFNLGPKPQSIKYKLAFAEVKGLSRPVPYVSSGELCNLTANDLAAAQTEQADEGGKLGNAIQFLKMELGDGPLTKSKLDERADRQGIKPATLRRAQQALKITPYQEGKHWVWDLPEQMRMEEAEVPF